MCTHTTCCTHIFSAHSACTVTFAHLHACTFTHGSSHVKKVFVACVSSLSISPSPLSCCTDPCCSLTVTSRPIPTLTPTTLLPNFPVLKAQDMRNSARAPSSLATWPSPVSALNVSPREVDSLVRTPRSDDPVSGNR